MNEDKVLHTKSVQCIDGKIRHFAFNVTAHSYLSKHFKEQNKDSTYDYLKCFGDLKNNEEFLHQAFYAMGITQAEDEKDSEWSVKKARDVLPFKDHISLFLVLADAISAAFPVTEEIKKKMSKERQVAVNKAVKKMKKKNLK